MSKDNSEEEDHFLECQDYEALRDDIQKARDACDEVKLSVAVDLAKELGEDYPFLSELYEAEDHLYDLMQCPEEMWPNPSASIPESNVPFSAPEHNSFDSTEG